MTNWLVLTNQEQKVLSLVAQGKRNAAIAHELTISVRTVEAHLYRIFDKLDVSSRTEAVLYVLQHKGHSAASSGREFSEISDDRMQDNHYAGITAAERSANLL
jgi:DNA-binding CsgD family transcriptional regulator